jgi:hypothetical protein
MKTQKMSYTNAALRRADATCKDTVLDTSDTCESIKLLLDDKQQTTANRHVNTLILGKRAIWRTVIIKQIPWNKYIEWMFNDMYLIVQGSPANL